MNASMNDLNTFIISMNIVIYEYIRKNRRNNLFKFEEIIAAYLPTTTIKKILNQGIKLKSEECCVCYNNFVDIIFEEVVQFLSYSQDCSYGLIYNDRFECLTCKNKVCCGCIAQMPDPDDEECDNYDESQDSMENTGRITCPVCRTKDFRLKIIGHFKDCCGVRGGVLPEEIIHDIKNISNRRKESDK